MWGFLLLGQPLVPPSVLLDRHHEHFIVGPSATQLRFWPTAVCFTEPRGSTGTLSRPPPRQPSPSSPSRGQQAAELLSSYFPTGTLPSLQRGRSASQLSLRGKGGAIGSSDGEEEKQVGAGPRGWSTGAMPGWARYRSQARSREQPARCWDGGTRRPAEPLLAGSHRGETGSWGREHRGEGAARTEVRGLRMPAPAPWGCWSSLCIPLRGDGMIQSCMCLSLSKALAAEPHR